MISSTWSEEINVWRKHKHFTLLPNPPIFIFLNVQFLHLLPSHSFSTTKRPEGGSHFAKCNQLLIYWGNHCLKLIFLDHCIFSFHLGVHSLETVLHKIVLLVVAAKRMKEEEKELPNWHSGAHIRTYNSMIRMPKRAACWHNWDWDLWKHWVVYKTLWNKWCDIVGREKLSYTRVLRWWCQLWPQILVFYQLLYLLYWVSICQLVPHGLKGWYLMGLSKTTMMTWMQALGLVKQGTVLPGCLHPLWHLLHHNCSSCTAVPNLAGMMMMMRRRRRRRFAKQINHIWHCGRCFV